MMKVMASFFRDESGATMLEYAILVALISIAAIVIIYFLCLEIRQTFNQVLECLKTPSACSTTSG